MFRGLKGFLLKCTGLGLANQVPTYYKFVSLYQRNLSTGRHAEATKEAVI